MEGPWKTLISSRGKRLYSYNDELGISKLVKFEEEEDHHHTAVKQISPPITKKLFEKDNYDCISQHPPKRFLEVVDYYSLKLTTDNPLMNVMNNRILQLCDEDKTFRKALTYATTGKELNSTRFFWTGKNVREKVQNRVSLCMYLCIYNLVSAEPEKRSKTYSELASCSPALIRTFENLVCDFVFEKEIEGKLEENNLKAIPVLTTMSFAQ